MYLDVMYVQIQRIFHLSSRISNFFGKTFVHIVYIYVYVLKKERDKSK
jgi:hypothetical protein